MKAIILALLTILSVPKTPAQAPYANKSVDMVSVDTVLNVRTDGTVQVTTKSVNGYRGHYHRFSQIYPFEVVGTLSDVSVREETTNKNFTYSPSRLDALDSNSWGRYTVYTDGKSQYIEWYMDAKDVTRTWVTTFTTSQVFVRHNDFDYMRWYAYGGSTTSNLAKGSVTFNFPVNTGGIIHYSSITKDHDINITKDPNGKSMYMSGANFKVGEDWFVEAQIPHGLIQSRETPLTLDKPLGNTNYSTYENVDVDMNVNKDKSISLTETQNIKYEGQFYYNARVVQIPKGGSVSNISVTDDNTHKALTLSPARLDSALSKNWKKYTTFVRDGYQYIEWYDSSKNQTRNWKISYTISNAFTTNKDSYSLVWPVFSSSDSWIENLTLRVDVFKPSTDKATRVQTTRSSGASMPARLSADNKTYYFSGTKFFVGEATNLSLTFPKAYFE